MERLDAPTLHNRIEKLRKEKKMTQPEFAKALGLDAKKGRSTINNWESGANRVKDDDLKKIAETFSVSADWLLGLSEHSILKEDVKAAAIYTGLSDESIEALHYIKSHGDALTDKFLDRELSRFYRRVIEPGIEISDSNSPIVSDGVDAAKTVFAIMELYISGSIPRVFFHYDLENGYELQESVAKYGINDERAYKKMIIEEIKNILERHREAQKEADDGKHQKD